MTTPEPIGVAGLVLAAGRSERMGGAQKLLLPYGDTTVIGSVLRAARRAGLSPLFVVLGHRSAELRDRPELTGSSFVENVAYLAGAASSLAAGVREAEKASSIAAVAVLLGDEPGLRAEVIRRTVDGWRRQGGRAARARYRDRSGHPVLLARSLFPVLGRLDGSEGPLSSLERHAVVVHAIEIEEDAPLDVDTPEAYREVLARLVH